MEIIGLPPEGVETQESELRVERGVHMETLTLKDVQRIVLEDQSKATVIIESAESLDIELGENADLELVEVNSGVSERVGILRAGAQLKHFVISLTGSGEEHNVFRLAGDGSLVEFNQAILGGKRHVVTNAIHAARNTESKVNSRSVVLEKGHVVTHSNMLIEKEGANSVSQLYDHALLLHKTAMAENIPGMEVMPNEVRAGHAASVSQISEDHLFYLMSRGLSESEAKRTIVISFLESAMKTSAVDVRALLDKYVVLPEAKSEVVVGSSAIPGMNRVDFPIFKQNVCGKTLVYLDSAATAQKPQVVVDAMKNFYELDNANIHRGLHTLSERATEHYESARSKVASFIGASKKELIFVRNATEGLNLLASTLGKRLHTGDTILLTEMEHHSNIVPWQLVAEEKGAQVRYVKLLSDGSLDMTSLGEEIARKPMIVSLAHVSNVLGAVNPIKDIVQMAHNAGSIVVVDAAQSIPHMKVDVHSLGCDALVFSGHKMMGPTGIGAVYVNKDLLRTLPPYMGGGGMIKEVTLESTSFKDGPERYEAGTPNVAGAIGLAKAVEYLERLGMDKIKEHNRSVLQYAREELKKLPHITIYGPEERVGSLAFNVGDIHAHDVSSILNDFGVAVRAGHHCAQPLMDRMGVPSMCRASFHCYNSTEDVDMLIEGLKEASKVFKL